MSRVILFPLIAAMGLLVFCSSCFSDSSFNVTRFMQYRNAADAAYINQDYATAEAQNKAALEEAEKKSSENEFVAQALHYLGMVYVATKRYDEAEGVFQRQIAVAEKVTEQKARICYRHSMT